MGMIYTKEAVNRDIALHAREVPRIVDEVVDELREVADRSVADDSARLSRETCDKIDDLCITLVDMAPVMLPSTLSAQYSVDTRNVIEHSICLFRERVSLDVGVDVEVSCAHALGMYEVTPETCKKLEDYVRRIGNAITCDGETAEKVRADVSIETVRDICDRLVERIEDDYLSDDMMGLSCSTACRLALLQDILRRFANDYSRLRSVDTDDTHE